MEICRTSGELDDLETLRRDGPRVFVPTMGALHEGHLSLVRLGRKLGPVVVSIFVNPTQFGEGEDFDSYPRDLDADLAMLEEVGAQAVFTPGLADMYGDEGEVTVLPGRRARGLCGGDRPGHFTGVLTVVAKLFGAVRPDIAIFGRKDAQQCLVIGQMVRDLKMPVRLFDAPTIREADGLAMSSRNRYLNAEQRDRALSLYRALSTGRKLLESGQRNREVLVTAMAKELISTDGIEYAEVRKVPDLDVEETLSGRILLAVSARVGPARLIDNFVLDVSDDGVNKGVLLDDLRDFLPCQGVLDELEQHD